MDYISAAEVDYMVLDLNNQIGIEVTDITNL